MTERFFPENRPPRRWELGTLAMVLTAVVACVFDTMTAVNAVFIRQYLLDGDTLPAVVRWCLANDKGIDLLGFLAILGYLLGFVAWRTRTVDHVRGRVPNPAKAIWHWTIPVWLVMLLVPFGVQEFASLEVSSPGYAVRTQELDIALHGLRGAAALVLLLAVWVLRRRVHRAYAITDGVTWAPVMRPPGMP
jgi:hypothetical protein